MKKRILSFVLILALCLSLLPATAQAVTVYEENTTEWHDGLGGAFSTAPLPEEPSGYAYLAAQTTQHAAAVWLANEEEAEYFDGLQEALDYAARMGASYKVKLLADAAGEYTAAGPMTIFLSGHRLEALTVNPGADTNEIRISGKGPFDTGDVVGRITNLTVSGGMATLNSLNVANITMTGGLLYPTDHYATYAADLGPEYTAPRVSGSLGQFAKHVDPIEESITQNLFTAADGCQIAYDAAAKAWYLKQKISSAVTLGPDQMFTYNGQPQGPAITVNGPTEDDYTVSYGVEISGGEFGPLDGPPTSAGEDYKVTVAAKEDSERYYGETSLGFKIAQAPLTIKAADQVINAGGEIVQGKYLVTGLMSGHTLSGVKLNHSGSQISIDETNVIISDASNNDVTDNYDIGSYGGTLTTVDASVTIVDISLLIPANLTYDGTDLSDEILITATADGKEVTPSGYDIVITDAQGIQVDEAVHAGAYTVTISVDTTENPTYAGTVTATFTIGIKALTLTADSKSAYVNGAEPAYTYTAGALAGGDSITTGPVLDCPTADMTTAGSYDITIDVSGVAIQNGQGTDVTANYAITGADGELTVSHKPTPSLTLTPSSASLSGGGAVTLTVGGLPTGGSVTVTCDNTTYDPTGSGATWSVTLPNTTATYVFTASFAGDAAHNSATATCTVTVAQRSDYTPPTYTPTVENTNGGDTTVSDKNPEKGDKVTITTDPDKGYEVGEITVTDSEGNPVEILDNGDGTYIYIQPAGKVTITVTYVCDGAYHCSSLAYSDLDVTKWYHLATDYVIENGLMNGIGGGKFDPNGTTSRAMIVTILWRLEGQPVDNYLMQFEDVPADTWYTEAVRWAASEEIVLGYNGKFNPNDPITREQLATILYRYEQYRGGGFTGAWMFLMDYTDRDKVSDWAYEAMCWTTMHGVVDGKPGKILDPKGSAKRCEVAQMLMNYLER